MGFDIYLKMNLLMCPRTGKPYYYRTNLEQCYELPNIPVPEELCEYLEGRGKHFHAYTKYFTERNHFETSAEEFLEMYPCFREIQTSPYYDEEWTEKNHLEFKRLLNWCIKQPVSFSVSWSF